MKNRATTILVADLSQLRELAKWMREEGVLYARCGELELRLGPAIAPPVVEDPVSPEDPDADERSTLEALLHSSGVDVEAFMTASRRARAA